MKPIKNIIFDLGGVILNINYENTSRAFKNLGLISFDAIYTQLTQTDVFDLYETGKIDSTEFINTLQKYIPNKSSDLIIDAWNAMLLDLPKEKVDFISNLRTQYKCFLFSNTNALHEAAFNKTVYQTIGQTSLDSIFDKIYLSHKIHYRKPQPEGFLHIINDQNLNIKETLFIDDSPQHIAGAKEVGLQTLYLPKGKDLVIELQNILEL